MQKLKIIFWTRDISIANNANLVEGHQELKAIGILHCRFQLLVIDEQFLLVLVWIGHVNRHCLAL
jgi:hypothetical protein